MGSNPGSGNSGGITDMLGGLGLGNSSISSPMVPGGGVGGGTTDSVAGSRLNKWINNLPSDNTNSGGGFPKAPGGPKTPSSTSGVQQQQQGGQQSGNTMSGHDDTWGPNPPGVSGWPDSSKDNTSNAANGAMDDFGIPEFQPGKPWKGPGMKNPDEDPTMTPGSVAMAPMDLNPLSKAGSTSSLAAPAVTSGVTTSGVPTSADNNSLGLTNSAWSFGGSKADAITTSATKDTWSNGGAGGGLTSTNSNLTPMGQDLWGKSAVGRTPPGLASGSNNAWPSNTSSNGWGSAIGGGNGPMNNGNMDGGPGWLLLKNLTPQIDGSTLKTLCMQHTQHGPLKAFHIFLNQGLALVHYSTGREAMKAQKALNGCQLNNTTIHAQSIGDQDAENFLQNASRQPQGGAPGSIGSGSAPSRGATPSSIATSAVTSGIGSLKTTMAADMWGSAGGVGSGGGSLFGGGSGGGGTWGMPQHDLLDQQRTTPALQSFLPNDLLGENH